MLGVRVLRTFSHEKGDKITREERGYDGSRVSAIHDGVYKSDERVREMRLNKKENLPSIIMCSVVVNFFLHAVSV